MESDKQELGSLVDRILESIDQWEREYVRMAEEADAGVAVEIDTESLTGFHGFDSFAREYASWAVKIRPTGEYQLLFEDGLSSGPISPIMAGMLFRSAARQYQELTGLDPIRSRTEIELWRGFAKTLSEAAGRLDSLWDLVDGHTGPAAQYIGRAAHCYLVGMSVQGLVMCRAALEQALEQWVPMGDKISLWKRIQDFPHMSETERKTADAIRDRGNTAVHEGEDYDLLETIRDLLELLRGIQHTIKPIDPEELPTVPLPGGRRFWLRQVDQQSGQ